jgi:hypothetical protein
LFCVELGIVERSEDGIEDGSMLVVKLGADERYGEGFEESSMDGIEEEGFE